MDCLFLIFVQYLPAAHEMCMTQPNTPLKLLMQKVKQTARWAGVVWSVGFDWFGRLRVGCGLSFPVTGGGRDA